MIKENPLISIIIPVYNVEKYLRQCLDSVVNQSHHNFEVICINDGSTDGSFEILQEYEQKYNFFKLYSQENKGLGATWNTGIGYASGDYIYFVDSDDYIESDLIENVSKIIKENEGVDIIRFRGSAFSSFTGERIEHPYINMKDFPKDLFNKVISFDTIIDRKTILPVNAWLGLCRRQLVTENNIKFDNLQCSNDVSFFYCTLAKARSIYISDKTFVHYRKDRENNLTSKRAKNFACDLYTFETIKNFTQNLPTRQKNYLLQTNLTQHIFYWFRTYFFTKHGKSNYKMFQKFLKNISLKDLDFKIDYFKKKKSYYYYFFFISIKYMPFYFFLVMAIFYRIYLYIKTAIKNLIKRILK